MRNHLLKDSIRIAEELAKEICTGETSESALLKDWKENTPKPYKKWLAEATLAEQIAYYRSVDTEGAVQEMHRQIFSIKRHVFLKRIVSIAASLLLILTVGTLWLMQDKPEEATWANAMPGNEKSIITTSDHQTIKLERPTLIVKNNQLINGNGEEQVRIAIKQDQGPQLNKLDVPAGGEHALTLEDGTYVKVNSATELWFPTNFGKNTRQVRMKGEAYFQVEADQQYPFIVHLTHNIKVQVTGTTFNIKSYDEENDLSVALVEGSVNILKDEEVIASLLPGQLFTYKKEEQQYEVSETELTTVTDWTNETFIFRDETIENIMRKLSRWYNVDIEVSDNIKEMHYTGILSRKQPLTETLEALRMTNELDFNFPKEKKVEIEENRNNH